MLIAHRLEHEYHALENRKRTPPTIRSFFGCGTAYSFGRSCFIFSERLKPSLELAETSGHRDSGNEGLEYTNQLRCGDRCCRTDFVVVVMAMASSRPVLRFAEACLAKVASLGKSTIAAWWLAILTVGAPCWDLLSRNRGMTILPLRSCFGRNFYDLRQFSASLRDLALLFVNSRSAER